LDIRNARGHIGDYHNLEVHAIPRNEYNSHFKRTRNIIYVLTEKSKYESLMVLNDKVIGHIDPHGGVTEYDNPFDYMEASDKPQKKKKKEEKKAPTPVPQAQTPSDVDEFLKWANEWDPISLASGLVDLKVDIIVEEHLGNL
jgi:hypothetical protein